ncbi:MAG: hypothetical protein AUJ39_00625 [Parcubacteria group bacterium CG1_02_42_13]|nr:MAG: hypothetical protein AUJ39_00625 [Parcubacteria group bacterium CG1_02_42_13]
MEKKIILLAIAIALIHSVAVFYNWYWRFLWIDVPMHFLGGVLAAIIFIWLCEKLPGHFNLSRNFFITALAVLSFTALVGVLWEFSEFVYDVIISSRGWGALAGQGARDMIEDLFFDLLGGLAVVVARRLRYNNGHSHDE